MMRMCQICTLKSRGCASKRLLEQVIPRYSKYLSSVSSYLPRAALMAASGARRTPASHIELHQPVMPVVKNIPARHELGGEPLLPDPAVAHGPFRFCSSPYHFSLRTSWRRRRRRGRRRRATRARVPRCNTLSQAVRHVAHNVRENNLLRPIVTRPDGLTDRDPAGENFPRDPLVQENNQRRIPGFRSVTKQKGLLLVNVQYSPIQNWRVSIF